MPRPSEISLLRWKIRRLLRGGSAHAEPSDRGRERTSKSVQRTHARSSEISGWWSRFLAWTVHHSVSLQDGLYRLTIQPTATFLSCLGIGIALALPLLLFLGLDNLQRLNQNWDHGGGISVFLQPGINTELGMRLATRVRSWEGVGEVHYQGSEESLAEFHSWSGLGDVDDVLSGLEENPLPPMLIVFSAASAVSPDKLERLRLELAALAEVDSARIDLEWVHRLHEITILAQRIVTALAVLLVFGALLAIVNNTRLMIIGRREEIAVIKLVGGTLAYVRRPFLYCGLLYGLGGAVMAWLLSVIGMVWLREPVQKLALLYNSDFVLQGLSGESVLQLFLGMGSLGLLGAWLAVAQYVRKIEPDFQY